jgi:hypothetical protein
MQIKWFNANHARRVVEFKMPCKLHILAGLSIAEAKTIEATTRIIVCEGNVIFNNFETAINFTAAVFNPLLKCISNVKSKG